MATESNSSSDESLDAKSEKFDPMKALYSSKSCGILSKEAPIFDNVSKFESAMKGLTGKPKKAAQTEGEDEQRPRRRFLPHQEPVPGTSRPIDPSGFRGRNVLTKMQRALGPLGMLHQCMENRTRVKVYTRSARGIRGHVEAYVAAFDKHWNLALEDCFEIWTRKTKRKAPALGPSDEVEPIAEHLPRVIVRESNKRTETLERHVPQMLLRGEQIAIIAKTN